MFYYDGIQITQFTKQDGLCSNRIRQILEDESGNIYSSTLAGINKYDGNIISKLMPVESNEWKLQKGDLWFYMIGKSDEYGPYRYDGKTLHHLRLPKHKPHDDLYSEGINSFFSPYEVYCIYRDRSGAMWFGTSVFGACRYNGHSLQWIYEKDLSIAPNGGASVFVQSLKIVKGFFGFVIPNNVFNSRSLQANKMVCYSILKCKASEMPMILEEKI